MRWRKAVGRGWEWVAHNVGYVIMGLGACLLVGREVAARNWGYAEARGGTYMYTCSCLFSLFCCVVMLVGHGVWWLVTGSGHPERLTVRVGAGLYWFW